MKEPEISLIIPVYNGEKHLPELFECVKNQTFKNFELILVNDGSSDRSLDICTSFAQEDERVRLIDKPNGGASSARNAGLNAARARWIVFADCDDLILKDYLQILIANSEQECLIIQGLTKIYHNNATENITFDEASYDLKHSINKLLSNPRFFNHGFPVSKIFDRHIIQKFNLRFNERVHYAEDLLFMLSYIEHCKTVKYISGSQYIYLTENSHSSQRHYSHESEFELYSQYLSIVHRLIDPKSDSPISNINSYSALLLMRSVFAIYFDPNYKRKSIQRKKRLRDIRRDNLDLLKYYYHPKPIIIKILRIMFLHSITVFDFICDFKFNHYAC